MNRFDHFVKEHLQIKGYIRYVDDFVLFAKSKKELQETIPMLKDYLQALRLILHPRKTHIYVSERGVPFLGFQVFPHYRYVLKAKRHRYRRHLRKKVKNPEQVSHIDIVNGANSWLGHISFGQSKRLKSQTFHYLRSKGLNLYQRRSGSWGLVDQQQ